MPVQMLATLTLFASALSPQANAQRAPCAVNVEFGSYAMGIDQGSFDRVSRLLKKDRGVRAVDAQRWGREGEVTLCVRVRKTGDMRRLFTRIRQVVPADPRGPITVTTRSGLRYSASKAD